MLSRSIFWATSASGISSLMARGGEGGGVVSMTAVIAAWDFLMRLLGCASGDSEREADADVEAPRDVFFDEAAAREACVTGTCMPRLGRDSDLRRVL
jgi:hypothetical protein